MAKGKGLKTLTVGELIKLLENTARPGNIAEVDKTWEVWQATDEEGNSYSPVVFDGINLDVDQKRIVLYPILVKYE